MDEINKVNDGNFIEEFVKQDLANGVYDKVQTRFPPEPNGYLHIGHAKAICIDFGIAEKFGGKCNLRLDDTNPTKEDVEYVDAIKEDIKWLGFDWDNVYYASDYFDFIYECAIKLIKMGKAYVCDLTADQIREYRGTLTEPGRNSPYRDRSVEENLDLFERMTKGEFENGEKVLRAKIDMASPNLNMRDPVIYRIMKVPHHRAGDKWVVYPMYDMAHPLSDAYEGVTHSLCSLEFENHRPLYNWFLEQLEIPHAPRQIEFARMNVNYTLTSKRKCLKLVKDGLVSGWNDPRMATLCGMRRRGYPAAAIRSFCEKIGVSKAYSVIDYALLESCVRDELNITADRAMAVLRPLEVVIDNYPDGQTEVLEVEINPRLKGAYYIKYVSCEKDADGNTVRVHCTYDPATKGGNAPDGRKVKGTIHWVSGDNCTDAEVRLYDRLFLVENPSDEEGVGDFSENLNPDSVEVISDCKIEKTLDVGEKGKTFQFMRQGYFCVDDDSTPEHPVFNRTVALKDSWAKKK